MIPSLVPLILATPAWSVTRLISKALFGLVTDWTNPSDVIYATQPPLTGFSGAGWSGSGMGPYLHTAGDSAALAHANALIVGNRYVITYEITGRTAGLLTAFAGTTTGLGRDADGTYTDSVTCAGNATLSFVPSTDFDGSVRVVSVENVSVTEALIKKGKSTWAGSKFTQSAAANMPYWDNGLNFDGVNDFMPHSGPPEKLHTSDGFTAAFVIEPEITVATGNRVILDQTNNNPTKPGIQVVYSAVTQQLTTRVANGVDWTVAGSTWLSRGIPHIVDARWSEAGGLRLSVDDHAVEVEGGVGGTGAAADLQLGRRVGGDYFAGRVSDLVVRSGEVPDRDIERWRGRMRGKHSFRHKTFLEGLEFAHNRSAQTISLGVVAGKPYEIDWGDGTIDSGTGTGTGIAHTHTYAVPGRYYLRIYVDLTYLVNVHSTNMGLTGSLWAVHPAMRSITMDNNPISGPLFDLSRFELPNTALIVRNTQVEGTVPALNNVLGDIMLQGNRLHGPLPKFSEAVFTQRISFAVNAMTGDIPHISDNYRLTWFYVENNLLTGYEPSDIGVLCTTFTAQNNLLPQSAIDQIITDFHTNLSNRPTTGTLSLGGSGNAAPSAAGKAKAQEIKEHGWTVTVNGGLD